MPLADDLIRHRDLILADLSAAHDYYTNTRYAWRLVQRFVGKGGRVSIRNVTTGSVTTEKELPGLARLYVADHLAVATLQQFVSLFEDFLFGLMRHWLLAHPQRLGKKQLPVSVVFEAADLETVKLAAVNRELHELGYKKVRDWFAFLNDLVNLGCPSADEIDRLAEVKATRDVFVHNRGVAGPLYEERAGGKKRFRAGERMDVTAQYHRESWELIKKVVADVSGAAIAKA